MSKSLTNTRYITDKIIYKCADKSNPDVTVIATCIDNQVRLQLLLYGWLLEYTYRSPIHVDINGAIVGWNTPFRLPVEMRNKLFSVVSKCFIVREIADFVDYYNDMDDDTDDAS